MMRLFLSIICLLSIAFGQIAIGVMNERGHEMREVDDDVYILNLKQEGQTILKLFAVIQSYQEYERIEWSTDVTYQVPHMGHKVDFPIVNPRSLTDIQNDYNIGYTMFGPLAWMSGSMVEVTASWGGYTDSIVIIFEGGSTNTKVEYGTNKKKGIGA